MNTLWQLFLTYSQKQYIKFIIVGCFNTLFGYSIFSLMIYMNLHYTIASLLATCIGVLFSMTTFSKFVFNQHRNNVIRFISVYAFTYFVNIFAIKTGTLFLNNLYVIGFMATIICALISYQLNKNFVFKPITVTN